MTLFAIWLTGALVLGLTIWLSDEFDFGRTDDVIIVATIAVAWPITLPLAAWNKVTPY